MKTKKATGQPWDDLPDPIRQALVKHLGIDKATWDALPLVKQDAHVQQADNAITITKSHYPDYATADNITLERYQLLEERRARFAGDYEKERDAVPTAIGRNVQKAHSLSGRARAEQYKPRVAAALVALDEFRRKNPNVSISEARRRVAPQHSISAKTLERHDVARRTK